MTWLKYLSMMPLLYALVKGAVELVEATMAGLPGAEKKKAVLDALASAWPAAQETFKFAAPYEVILPVLSFLIDLVVAIYNLIGYFKKDDAPTPA
jgi:hypothetical protein